MTKNIRFFSTVKIILISVFVFAILDVYYVNCVDNSAESDRERRDAGDLEGHVFNFGEIAPDIPLLLEDKRINVDNLILNEDEAVKIWQLLHGFTLAERMRAWAFLALIDRLIGSSSPDSYDIEDLDQSEDDIILTAEQLETVYNGLLTDQDIPEGDGVLTRQKRKLLVFALERWPTTIPWKFRSQYSTSQKANIKAGMAMWQSQTCLRFVEKKNTKAEPHIRFYKPPRSSCTSFVGLVKPNGQDITLGTNCNDAGSSAHEIGHALGLLHEQSRPDRDTYIEIVDANIENGREINFAKIDWISGFTAGIPYDFGSLMHYEARDFSINKKTKPTINSKWSFYEHTMGDRTEPSFYDVKAINMFYCSDVCHGTTLAWQRCDNDGYRDPNDCSTCVCQRGWAPPFCNTLLPHTNPSQCGEQILIAEAAWHTLRVNMATRFPSRSPDVQCVWKIKSPPATRVHLTITELDLSCERNVCGEYLEIRFSDLSRVGPRFCCTFIPTSTFPSHGREMMLLYKLPANAAFGTRSFAVKYKHTACGGCHPTLSRRVELVCLSMHREECDPHADRWICGYSICELSRVNTCYVQVPYCCSGYTRVGINCERETRLAAPPPLKRIDCARPRADVVFLMDVSDKVDAPEFQREKLLVEDIVNGLRIGADAAQVGIVTFSETAHVELHLNADLAGIISAVTQITRPGGNAHTSKALETVRQQSFSTLHGDRRNAPNILVVLTSGQSAKGFEPVAESRKLHQAGVSVIALGTGVNASKAELKTLASNPAYLFEDANFHALHGVINTINRMACHPAATTTRTRATTTTTMTTTTTTTTISPTVDPSTLGPCPIDICITVDTSSSVSRRRFTQLRDGLIRMVQNTGIGIARERANVAICYFGTTSETIVPLVPFHSIDDIISSINESNTQSGRTKVSLGLRCCIDQIATSRRRTNAQIVYALVIDGNPSDPPNDAAELEATRALINFMNKNGKLVVYAIGNAFIDMNEIRSWVDQAQISTRFYWKSSFAEFRDSAGATNTLNLICYPRPTNGEWSSWQEWSVCSVTCMGGIRHRIRPCASPAPAWGRLDCEGDYDEEEPCNEHSCIEPGYWSRWSPWSDCSVTCGRGRRTRDRTCDNPPPSFGAPDCDGNRIDDGPCNTITCSTATTTPPPSTRALPDVDGGWSRWSSWTGCSVTCGSGTRTMARLCTNPPVSGNGAQCSGRSVRKGVCFFPACG